MTCNKIFFLAWVPPLPLPLPPYPASTCFSSISKCLSLCFSTGDIIQNDSALCDTKGLWKGAIPQCIYLNLYNYQSLGRREVKGVSRRGHSRGGDSDESELLCSGYGGSKLTGHDRKHGSHGGHLEDIHSAPVNLHRSQLTPPDISIIQSVALIS